MNKRHPFSFVGFIFTCLFITFFFQAAWAEEGLTLQQCYQLALKRSETIAIDQQVIKEAEAQFLQSLSGILPKVSYDISEERQDGAGGTSFTLKHIPEHRFMFSQPLFSGFKEFAGIAGAKAQRKQREEELIRAKQLLFTDVSNAFYFLQSYDQDYQAVEDIHNALEERITELKRRENLGRSRASEVANAQAKLYAAEANLEAVKTQQEVGRELLEFLTGIKVDSIKDSDLSLKTISGSMDDFLKYTDDRPDVKAAKHATEVAQHEVSVARAGYWPTVAVNGNYYTKRVGNAADVKWDITLDVNVPIFNGTLTFGDVKQAKAQLEEAKLNLNRAQRSAQLDIQNAYTTFIHAQKRVLALKKAADAANTNYQLQKKDYASSLVNNLDVLQALEDWQTEFRSYIAVNNEAQRDYWNLKVSIGDLHDAL
jgi:outer membrane protein